VAGAVEPSVPLTAVGSTPVSSQGMDPTGRDDASDRALRGNQAARAASEGSGTTSATPLSPTAVWDVSAHTGDFSWSYPLRVPPAPGGLVPNLALSYRSSEVDGRTSAANNQPSWIGDGWALTPGFVERTYGACAQDTDGFKPPQVGDLCWRSDNAFASYGSGGGSLICCDADDRWRSKVDDGARIERLKGIGNGDNDGEHWKITTVDGTEYWFGSQLDSQSTWTVPVFGDDAGEPCNQATFDASQCRQAWRWALDKVVDRNGNIIRYFYEQETNSYGLNLKDAAASYTRGGTLTRIDYGLRDNVSTPTGRVVFTTADRCVPGSNCVQTSKENWPDTDLDNKCDTATCKDRYSPTFWSTKRLASITTQVWRDGRPSNVDRWDLAQEFPDPGDGEKAALWLKSIRHTGLVGGEKAMPEVTFTGTPYDNRVDSAADGLSPLRRFRITGVISESGGWTSITYGSQCKPAGPIPNKDRLQDNTLRCFPVRWNKKNHAERLDFFHKYVVDKVIQSDRMSANTQMVTSYEYLDGAAWHWDLSEFVKEDKKTWNEFRGYGRVRTRSGAAADPAGAVTMTEQRFYRGMHGDKDATGTRSVTDSEGGSRTDEDWLAGFGFETATFEREGPSAQADPPRIAKSITEPVVQGPTATRGAYKAYLIGAGVLREYTLLADNKWRTTRTETSYDDRGLPTKVNDLGDTATADDDRCVRTTYTRNTGKWLLNLPGTVETVSVSCTQTAVFPRDAIGATRTIFDGNGNRTRVDVAKERPAADPIYRTISSTDYDQHGRPTAVSNALSHTVRTAYSPALGGPLTQTVTTTPPTEAVPAGLVTTAKLEPAWGTEKHTTDPNGLVTEVAYDPLGRTVQAWLPNRSRADYTTRPSVAYDYQVNRDAPTSVKTTRVGPTGAAITSTAIYDGFLRERQVQSPAVGGGRLLTDTRYDSQGRVWKSTQPYFNNATVDTTLWVASEVSIPGHTRAHYDGAGRQDASIYFAGTSEKWRTTTSHGGDRTTVTPPAGGTTTTTIVDARGQTRELRERSTSDSFEATRYTYTKAGKLETITGPDGAVWRYGYDLLGRQTSATDPDTGSSTTTYTDLDQVATTKNSAGITVAYAYDTLGRKTGTFLDRVGGTDLTGFTYDTAWNGKGQLASATRYVTRNGTEYAYTSEVYDYDTLYQPTGTAITIPSIEGLLAGTYESYAGYNPDGTLSGESYAEAGELPDETVNYTYDATGPAKTSSGGYEGSTVKLVSNTEYTRYGELARLQLGTGTNRVWLSNYYDTNTRRLNRSIVDAEVPAPMQADRRYTYTNAGTITSLADVFANDIQCFRYDPLRRLTDVWTPAKATWTETTGCQQNPDTNALAGPAKYRHSYTYDKAGNRLTEIQHAGGGNTTRTYTYGTTGHVHALKSVTTTGPGVNAREDYTYEPTGQVDTRTRASGTQDFTWDAEGRLATATENGKTNSFVYDANGVRLIRRDPNGTTLYLGKQELRLNAAGGNPTVTRYYTQGSLTVAMRQGRGALTWLAGDHQATSQIAINSVTKAVTQRRQLPFGAPRGTAVFPGERGFVGGTIDAGTGLTHLGAREYDPATGRFVSVDPIINPDEPHQLNGYTYANNNPVTFSDPSGLYCDSCDFYARRDGTTSVWTPPPPPPRPVISRVDQQVWRQEKGSKTSLVRTLPAPKFPALNHSGDCRMSTGAFSIGIERCGYNKPVSPEEHKVLELCTFIPFVGIPCAGFDAMFYIGDEDWGGAIGALGGVIPGGHRGGKGPMVRPRGACSFAADTKVVLGDGTTKPISEIKKGEQVLAADPLTGKQGPRTVTALVAHEDTVQDLVLAGGGKVTTTGNHPFWNDTDKQWQRADQLGYGDSLFTTTGSATRVVGLLPAASYIELAYNLTVDDLHTYYVLVGDGAVLVHNTCPTGIVLLGRMDDIAKHKSKNSNDEFNTLNLQGTQKDKNGQLNKGPGSHNWTRNKQFIDDALDQGAEIRLVTDPTQPIYAGGNWYQSELKYLDGLGYKPEQRGDYWVLKRK
jgi:RHS repeat-associated protein